MVSTTPRKAICQISDNTNNIFGWFNLEELQKASGVNGVRIWGKVNGLTENKKYGFHVHTNGVAAPKTSCANSGGIYNPLSKKHGLTCDAERMVGDLQMLQTGALSGGIATATYDNIDSQASLWGTNSILGRSLVIMSQED